MVNKFLCITIVVLCAVFQVMGQESNIRTEYGALDSKSQTIDLFILQTASEYYTKPYTLAFPYSTRELYSLPSFDQFELYGKKYSVFKPLPQSRYTRIQTGNEVGDPLMQELRDGYVTESNRTPMTELTLYSPIVSGWKALFSFEQVDHFSAADITYKQSVLNRTNPTFEAINYSWFGENYPQYSSFVAGVEKKFSKGISRTSYRDGWLWLNLKGSGRLLPYKLRTAQTELAVEELYLTGKYHYKRYLGDELLTHRTSYTTEYSLEYRGNSINQSTHKLGFDIAVRGDDPLVEYDALLKVIPFAQFDFKDEKSFTLTNTLAYNGSYFLLRDSLMVRSYDTLSGAGVNLLVTNAINPKDDYTERPTSNFQDSVRMRHTQLMQSYAAEFYKGEHNTLFEWNVYTSPWVIMNPHYFKIDSIVSDGGYLLRSGGVTSHGGNAWGLKNRLKASLYLHNTFTVRGTIHLQKVWGSAQYSFELTEPELATFIEAQYHNSFGLQVSANAKFQTVQYLNGWGATPYEIAGHWEYNLTIAQYLYNNSISVWASALNIGARELKEHPNGAFDRFRIIVGGEWRY
ncbi:MAG: hypothetical protein OCD01_16190 [Fibrobacterales bacterium]